MPTKSASLQAVILAAGRSSRFQTGSTKLSFTLCGQEMIVYAAKIFHQLSIPTTLVVGYHQEVIREIIARHELPRITFVEQKEQKGTGHALLCTQSTWHADHIIIMNGDMPLVTQNIIGELIAKHLQDNAAMSFVTAYNGDPSLTGYGKVIKENGSIKIVEARECTHDESSQPCVNAGIYVIKKSFLEKAITELTPHTDSGELYITDLVEIAQKHGLTVSTTTAPFDDIRGINTLKELWMAEHIKRCEIISGWMSKGVRFSAAQNVHIDLDVSIGSGSFIGAGVMLLKGTRIGKNCHIDAFSFLDNALIHDKVRVLPHTVVSNAELSEGAQVGPFAHIHHGSHIGKNAIIGNFVEVTKSSIGADSKAKHLSYLGMTNVGSHVNIGAGTITCNYNGFTKHPTTIEDHAQIGSNNCLIAPVTIGKNSMTAAGSVITEDVPENALGIARARQENKESYVEKLQQRYTKPTTEHQL